MNVTQRLFVLPHFEVGFEVVDRTIAGVDVREGIAGIWTCRQIGTILADPAAVGTARVLRQPLAQEPRLADYEGCLAHEQAMLGCTLHLAVGYDDVMTCAKEALR